jgi:hypothetical protein
VVASMNWFFEFIEGFSEPGYKPTTNQKRFVVATRTRIFIKVAHTPIGAPPPMKMSLSVGANQGTAVPQATTSLKPEGRRWGDSGPTIGSHIEKRTFL